MTVTTADRAEEYPWEKLEHLIRTMDTNRLDLFLKDLTPAETALAISRLSQKDQTALITLLTPEDAADVIEDVSDTQAVDIIEDLPPNEAAAIVDELRSDKQADLLGELDDKEQQAILEKMDPEESKDVRQLLEYEKDTAGGIMITEYLSYRENTTIEEVLKDLRTRGEEYSDYEVQYVYITSEGGLLRGVLRLRDILLSAPNKSISSIMKTDPQQVRVATPLEDLIHLFDNYSFIGIPVTDEKGVLVGVIGRDVAKEAAEQTTQNSFLKVSGIVGGEELRSMPLFSRSFRRLGWLGPNIILNIIAASVIALYQETLQAAIVLAVFLPIISDMSGCSGNQAVAVSIRELALGLIRRTEFLRVFLKEIGLGLINGVLLGILLGSVAYLWKGNIYLGLVVGSALALNTLLSVVLGGLAPLVLRRLKVDPALASGPLLTTITDMCGFFFVLNFASIMLSRLT